jgi:hypothetical protein
MIRGDIDDFVYEYESFSFIIPILIAITNNLHHLKITLIINHEIYKTRSH